MTDNKPTNVTHNRNKYIGGSDLPNILGFNEAKYDKSIFEFAKQKLGLIPNDFKGNAYTKYGNLLEPIIRDYMNSFYGRNYVEDSVCDEVNGYRSNTDGIDHQSTDPLEVPMLEVKTFGKELDVEYYTPQCRFYLKGFNKHAIALVGYPRPDNFYTGVDYDLENGDEYFDMSFDPDLLQITVIEHDEAEWQRIESRVKAFQTALGELKKNPDMTIDEWNTIFYSPSMVTLKNQIVQIEQNLIGYKELTKQYETYKAQMLDEFTKYGIKTFDTGAVKITHVKSDDTSKFVFDETKFKKAFPDTYTTYLTKEKKTKGKNYMLITVKKIGDKELEGGISM